MSESFTPGDRDGSEFGPFLKRLEDARRELLDPSTRSRLLHTPLGSRTAKIIEVKDELAEEVFRLLVTEGKSLTFLPAPEESKTLEDGSLELPQPEENGLVEGGLAARHTDTRLQTALLSAKLQKRLLSIAYDAQTIEAEQGVNILYLALGFLRWFEPQAREKARFAPLILIPVTLTRASANERFRVTYSGEELSTNLSLQERLKEEAVDLPALPEAEDLSPNAYAAAVAAAVAGLPRWEVQRDAVVLGFFSFAKLMMWKDLDPTRWPAARRLEKHPILSRLLGEGFRGDHQLMFGDDSRVDEVVDIGAAPHVVDADSSQMLAIEEVQRGRNLVIQGPPGTGKSQTITNLIAGAVSAGRRVLFIAEKMAALEVVRANLERARIGAICLELHSHKAKKRAVLEDLEQTYSLRAPRAADAQGVVAHLRATRDRLNEHALRMHAPLLPSMSTPFRVFGGLARLAGRGVTPPDFALPEARKWDPAQLEERVSRIERLADLVAQMGVPSEHMWRGVGLDVVLPPDAIRLSARAADLANATADLIAAARASAQSIAAPSSTWDELARLASLGVALRDAPPLDPAALAADVWVGRYHDITALIDAGVAYEMSRRQLVGMFVAGAWEEDLADVKRELVAHGHSWLRWFRREYRVAVARFRRLHVGKPPRAAERRIALLTTLSSGQRARERVHDLDALGAAAFSIHWQGERSDWQALRAVERWVTATNAKALPLGWRSNLSAVGDIPSYAQQLAGLEESAKSLHTDVTTLFDDLVLDLTAAFGTPTLDEVPLAALEQRLRGYAVQSARLQEWSIWRIWGREAGNEGLGIVIEHLGDGRLPADRLVDAFRFAALETLAQQVFEQHPSLQTFQGRTHEQVVAEFQELDRRRLGLASDEVAARHLAALPQGTRDVGEIGILAREWKKQRRHLPLRQLIKAAGRAIQGIKPVWMMSPMSLAWFVEPGCVDFDLVLMDEASQVRPVDALGAIARANQVVVVGDDKQLPPTSFFDRAIGGDEDAADPEDFQAGDVESILGLCASQGLPDKMLRWHYRSRHESLITVSNLEFYRGRLFVVPSAESEALGLRFRHVQGVYDRGGTKTNRLEAKAVAAAVVEHARQWPKAARFPDGMSLGVGTFSVAQRDAILDEIELIRRQNPDLEPFFDTGAPEPFFVKNLESIQGDERDVVFISVGYGPDPDGYMAMQFGPLVSQGGERRLNVLISRARHRCEVFSSITAADIDLARTQSVGVRVLREFLHYAETRVLERPRPGVREADSDFEIDVATGLARLGYQVEQQVGVAGFFVDLAIKDPGRGSRYLLGIECDGATYHSSRSARDRDRIREQVLRDRGWRIHRIWSTDWFRRRDEELGRAVAAIEAARGASPDVNKDLPQAGQAAPEPGGTGIPRPAEAVQLEFPTRPAPTRAKYVEAQFRVGTVVEPHQLAISRRADIVLQIVSVEGPVHEDEVARRFATVCGAERAGPRIQDAAREALEVAVRRGSVLEHGGFYSLGPISECAPRDRSQCRSLTLRNPAMLPPVEIRTGLMQVVAEQIGVAPDDAIVEVARMFGFQRTGAGLHEVVEEQLRALLADGVLVLRNANKLYAT